ncbi:MAG TPA: hypothetical protein V6C97_01825 [Oculatellaceae cyanobacterium]
MPLLEVLEKTAELATTVGKEIPPGKLEAVIGEVFGKSEPALVEQAAAAKSVGTDSASKILGALELVEGPGVGRAVVPSRDEIIQANQALVSHITDLMPQASGGQLDWILGGSSASNVLAGARKFKLLDATKLPNIVPHKTVELSEGAVSAFQHLARQTGDLDVFVVNGGKNAFLNSQFVSSMKVAIPQEAEAALKAVGEARSQPLIQPVRMEFDNPQIAAVEAGDRTVYVTAPGQLLANKFRQVMRLYSPQEAGKTTGDFANLLDATSHLYSEPELLQLARQSVQRNNLLYEGELNVPWDKSPENLKFTGFMRKVFESEERNGQYLKGLKVDDVDSLNALRLFEKHPAPQAKQAIADFINEHGDAVRSLDIKGSAERALYVKQGGTGRASEAFMRILHALPASSEQGGADALTSQLQELKPRLVDLPSLDPARVSFRK